MAKESQEVGYCPVAGKECMQGKVDDRLCQFWGAKHVMDIESGKYKVEREACLLVLYLERK